MYDTVYRDNGSNRKFANSWFDESGITPGYTYLASGPIISSTFSPDIEPNENG